MNDCIDKDLRQIFNVGFDKNLEFEWEYKNKELKIEYSKEYSCPDLQFSDLKALSEYFGTDKIYTDMDWINEKGCETCDYGSRYGYQIIISDLTKNIPTDK
jgi:hypothetical protein